MPVTKAVRNIPSILIEGEDNPKSIKAGEVLFVKREYFRNGEYWTVLEDGREVPAVFIAK